MDANASESKRQMKTTKDASPDIVIGDATIGSEQGLTPLLGRKLRDALQAFTCSATIHNARGVSADARNLLELLLLGAGTGERLAVRCAGPDARAAYTTLVRVLETGGGAA